MSQTSGGEPVARVPEVALIAVSVGTRTFALEFVSRKIEETRDQVAPKVGTATWNDTANGRAENSYSQCSIRTPTYPACNFRDYPFGNISGSYSIILVTLFWFRREIICVSKNEE